jgi:hypothetical protein
VDSSASPVIEDGLTWATAFTDIQPAIDSAALEVPACEVWVAEGAYVQFNQTDTIAMAPDVELYGGFGGLDTGETERDQRNPSWSEKPVVISGNFATNHVIIGAPGTVVDGFTIVNGAADGPAQQDQVGAGILIAEGPVTVRNCRFVSNHADQGGGAVHVESAFASFELCRFDDNTTGTASAAGWGSAINVLNGTIEISGCEFDTNRYADGALGVMGSAIGAKNSNTTMGSSSFIGNTSLVDGAIYLEGGTHTFSNLTFENNDSPIGGAALAALFGADITATNIVMSNNGSSGANTIYIQDSAFSLVNGTLYGPETPLTTNTTIPSTAVNCIIWTDALVGVSSDSAVPSISYSVVKGGHPGTVIYDTDPLFVSVPDNLRLTSTSVAIDAADGDAAPDLDIVGTGRINTPADNTGIGTPSYADIGAYEYVP